LRRNRRRNVLTEVVAAEVVVVEVVMEVIATKRNVPAV